MLYGASKAILQLHILQNELQFYNFTLCTVPFKAILNFYTLYSASLIQFEILHITQSQLKSFYTVAICTVPFKSSLQFYTLYRASYFQFEVLPIV